MGNDLTPLFGGALQTERVTVEDALGLLYSGRSEQTVKAYRSDLDELARWADRPVASVLDGMVRGSAGEANMLALRWRGEMVDAGLSPATVNRRLAALRSILKVAKTIGMISWSLEVTGVRGESYKDMRGPTLNETEAVLSVIRKQKGILSVRNEAMVRLMYDMALRRNEVASLDVADIEIEASRVWVLGKGKREKIPLTMPGPTKSAIKAWMAHRPATGPLFVSVDRHGKQHARLTGSGLYHIVVTLAGKVGVVARPHGLRHGSITRALDITKGDIRAVRKFSRHVKVETVLSMTTPGPTWPAKSRPWLQKASAGGSHERKDGTGKRSGDATEARPCRHEHRRSGDGL